MGDLVDEVNQDQAREGQNALANEQEKLNQ
jgi:hypothetical protein